VRSVCWFKNTASFDWKELIDRAEEVLFRALETEAAATAPTSSGATDRIEVAQRLSRAESAWFSYRVAECSRESDVALGGTGAPLLTGLSDVTLDQQRLRQLHAFYEALKDQSDGGPPFPKG
jgi:uncharacterized protein YecT (DUF1311 family)